MLRRYFVPVLLCGLLFLAEGCSQYQPFRALKLPGPDQDCICQENPKSGASCQTASVISTPQYILGFVEFDELGWFWNRRQKDAVVEAIQNAADLQDVVIVAYAHGWNHNASSTDENVTQFQQILARLSKLENESGKQTHRPPRRIVGVYMGWRGAAFQGAGHGISTIYNWTSFFSRRGAARRVGSEDATELLSDLGDIRSTTNRKPRVDRVAMYPTRLVVVGHSFGAAVIYGAVSRILVERRTHLQESIEAASFGDLVVLVNPAIEASLLIPFETSSNKHSRSLDQPFHPILAVFASRADTPNQVLFPIARSLTTRLKRHRHDDPEGCSVLGQSPVQCKHFQGRADRTAAGHLDPTVSFLLCPKGTDRQKGSLNCVGEPDRIEGASKSGDISWGLMVKKQLDGLKKARTAANPFERGALDRLPFTTSTLFRVRSEPTPMTPYPIIAVDSRLIQNHNDIFSGFFASFLIDFVSVWADSSPAYSADTQAPAVSVEARRVSP